MYWAGGHPSYPGTGQVDQCSSPSSEAQDTGQPCYEDSRGSIRGENTSPFPKMNKHICVSEELRTIIYFEKININIILASGNKLKGHKKTERNQKQLHVG